MPDDPTNLADTFEKQIDGGQQSDLGVRLRQQLITFSEHENDAIQQAGRLWLGALGALAGMQKAADESERERSALQCSELLIRGVDALFAALHEGVTELQPEVEADSLEGKLLRNLARFSESARGAFREDPVAPANLEIYGEAVRRIVAQLASESFKEK